jgi:hypothetical protein
MCQIEGERKKCIGEEPGFLLRILRFSQNGDHPENNLAKFGYIIDSKVGKKKTKKKKNRSWLPSESCHKTPATRNFLIRISYKFA